MILALMVLFGCVVLGTRVANALRGRPSAGIPFVAFPLITALLGAPIVLEEGCKSTVVTGTPETGLGAHYIAWCPDRCVNVPDRFTQTLVLPNGVAYDAYLAVEPIAATRFVWDDLPQRAIPVPWADEVETILRKHVEPVFTAYLLAHENVVLHRNSNNTDDRAATAGELLRALQAQGLPFTSVMVSMSLRR